MDRVSNLSDDVLCHILSSLPTKQAAVTSILSKRWVHVWKLVPDLDIDDSVFLHPEDGKGQREEIRQSFVHFMDTVLAMQGDSPVKKFSLKCITGVDPDCVNRWIRNVLERGVSNLKLFLDFAEEFGYKLPDEMFVSKTLAELKLRSDVCVDWWRKSGGAFLPTLKSLEIDSEKVSYDEADAAFIPSFTVLEELQMASMEWMDSDITVSSSSLRKLNIQATGWGDYINPETVCFDTPNLLSFCYSDLVAEDYPLVNMKKVIEATIKLILKDSQIERVRAPNNDWLEVEDEDEVAVLSFGNVVKLLNGIQNAQRLSIFADTLEVLSLCESMPVFKNLKFLGMTSEEGRGWQAMPVLLKNCPHLETIIIEGLLHHVTDKCGDACPCIPREEKGRSLTSCPVKLLEIQRFRATMKEMEIIKHFLDYFPSLKEMKVYIEENDPTQLKNPEVSKGISEMFELYNKLYSCNVQLLVSDNLYEKWIARGSM